MRQSLVEDIVLVLFRNLLAKFLSFAHFLKTFFHHSACYSSCFHFRSCPLIIRYIPSQLSETRRHCYRKTTSRLNKLLLGNWRTNRERVILPSSQSKIKKKNTLFIDQPAFSNFALRVIKKENPHRVSFFDSTDLSMMVQTC